MKVLLIHNRYAQPGGEDVVVETEARLLRSRGVTIVEHYATNGDIIRRGSKATLQALWHSNYNWRSFEEVRRVCRQHRPDVAHVHNFWFALSPSVHAACHAEGVPTVQTLHNFRLVCPGSLLTRNGKPCEVCLGHFPWRGVWRRCYRDSVLQTAFVTRMIVHNRRRGTWERDVDIYLALTEQGRRRFIAGGIPAGKILVKPHSLEDPGATNTPGCGALFVGRLSSEKGVRTLLAAWKELAEIPLTIVGDGPLRNELEERAKGWGLHHVALAGRLTRDACIGKLRRACFLVVPSECLEGFPLVLLEAMAVGRPVLAARIGALAELVDDGRTGLLFTPGDPYDLAEKARRLARDPGWCAQMGRTARQEYETKYTPERNYEMLLVAYERAMRMAPGRAVGEVAADK